MTTLNDIRQKVIADRARAALRAKEDAIVTAKIGEEIVGQMGQLSALINNLVGALTGLNEVFRAVHDARNADLDLETARTVHGILAEVLDESALLSAAFETEEEEECDCDEPCGECEDEDEDDCCGCPACDLEGASMSLADFIANAVGADKIVVEASNEDPISADVAAMLARVMNRAA